MARGHCPLVSGSTLHRQGHAIWCMRTCGLTCGDSRQALPGAHLCVLGKRCRGVDIREADERGKLRPALTHAITHLRRCREIIEALYKPGRHHSALGHGSSRASTFRLPAACHDGRWTIIDVLEKLDTAHRGVLPCEKRAGHARRVRRSAALGRCGCMPNRCRGLTTPARGRRESVRLNCSTRSRCRACVPLARTSLRTSLRVIATTKSNGPMTTSRFSSRHR